MLVTTIFLKTYLLALPFALLLGIAPINNNHALTAHAKTLNPVPPVLAVVEPKKPVPQPVRPNPAPRPQAVRPAVPTGLLGVIGYARAGGNCVDAVGHRQNGNPSTWRVRSSVPTLGAAALWANINHVGLVVGIWSNGDLEIVHFNWNGSNQHRFPARTFRGFS